MKNKKLLGPIVLVAILAIVCAVNIILSALSARVDLTAERLYTLSDGSKAILTNLNETVTLKLYFSESAKHLPPSIKTYAKRVRDLLNEYKLAGDGKIVLEFYDPKPDSDEEEWAKKAGLDKTPTEPGNPQSETIYFGLVAACGTNENIVASFDSEREASLEYDITRSITRVVWPRKPVVGVLSGIPGVLDPRTGRVPFCTNLGWHDVPVIQLMQKVIEDFEAAYNSVPETPSDRARVNKYAAAAMLAKCYLTLAYGDGYEASNGYSHINQQYMQKVVELTGYIANSGKFGYEADFGDLFMENNEGNIETIFSVQHSDYIDDNTKFGRNNWSNMLNGCWGIWSKGWDFHKPTQNLVNAFKVDANGFPMFDTYDNEHNIHPVNGIPVDQKWDPRLFHTVGMPTFPYKYEAQYTLTTDNSRNPANWASQWTTT